MDSGKVSQNSGMLRPPVKARRLVSCARVNVSAAQLTDVDLPVVELTYFQAAELTDVDSPAAELSDAGFPVAELTDVY